ncbi:hypothetical protein BN7_5177 [Wickerhamomyces ciferrii]|uniref:Uncharacterized protein n=1 Tax=Wickerhamomyces ciferrii (strain ATCC 14091 / BCRC 22168 / CBS 111 / JCM 3599 / NBRC 0793 / NRRL Y-1031 F-60-10) TaxID=1206466 RepID=K0KVS4_WICCF|nr:uncharacterized protein BN7_5177 [Wickerhamomyces ciferrii]CCH45594.1 hypothetical protein BN7_5177 [Wickerhamomyces ciferrii]
MSLEIPTKESNKKRKDQDLLNAFNQHFNESVDDVQYVKKILNNPKVRPWYMDYKEKVAQQNRINNGWRPPKTSSSSSSHQQQQLHPSLLSSPITTSTSSVINEPLSSPLYQSTSSNFPSISASSSTLIPSTIIQNNQDSNDPLIQLLLKEFNDKKALLIENFETNLKNLEDEYNKKIKDIQLQTFIKDIDFDEDN